MNLISIVIPVYNAEKYIGKCIESILYQSFTDWECLLIDDGSTDNSLAICNEYAEKDKRIRVFHKENGGVSAARQTGIDSSIGEYVIHVDADDWIEPDMLENLYIKAEEENADMVICDYFEESRTNRIVVTQSLPSYEHLNVLKDMYAGKIYGCCWNKLVRRKAIHESNARFPIGVNHCEDAIFNAQLMLHDIRVVHIGKPLYHYRLGLNVNSILMSHSSLYEVYEVRNRVLFPILNPIVPELVDRLKFQLKYLAYAEMRPWKEYHDCYYEINERLKEPYECSSLKSAIIYYTVKYPFFYDWMIQLRKLKKKWKIN